MVVPRTATADPRKSVDKDRWGMNVPFTTWDQSGLATNPDTTYRNRTRVSHLIRLAKRRYDQNTSTARRARPTAGVTPPPGGRGRTGDPAATPPRAAPRGGGRGVRGEGTPPP